MKRIVFILFLVVAIAVWSTPSFAVQNVGGAGNTNLSGVNPGAAGTGVLEGVAMDGTAGQSLTVGTQDIFTANQVGGVILDSTLSAVSTLASACSTIIFNGTSTVYGRLSGVDPGDVKIYTDIDVNGVAGDAVNFLGTVTSAALHVGPGTVSFRSFTNNPITNTTFTDDGFVSVGPNTTVTSALNGYAAEKGTLVLDSNSIWTGAVGGPFALRSINVVGGNNTTGVAATITGQVDCYSFDLGTNTLTVNGKLIIDNPGPNTIKTTLASDQLYGHIIQLGGAGTTLPATLGVSVLVPAGVYLTDQTLFNIVQSTTGAGTSVVTVTNDPATNPLYIFAAVPLAGTTNGSGDVTIQVIQVPAQAPIVLPPNVLPPIAPIATVIAEALLNTPTTPDLASILAAINALPNAVDIVNAEAQLAPLSPNLVAPLVNFQGTRLFENLWLTRLDMCSEFSQLYPEKEDPSCRGNNPRSGWWQKGFAYFGTQKDNGMFLGFHSRILGTMIAYDAPLGSDTRAGLGVGYARSAIVGNTFHTRTDFDSYQTMGYIGHERGPWFVNGAALFGWNNYSGRRHILFSGVDRTAEAEYSGQDYTAFASTGYHFSAQKFTITPIASLQYSRVNLSGYTEKGAGDINLKVSYQGYNFYESGLGVKVARDFSYRGGTYVPDIHAKWLHEFSNPSLKETAEFNVPGSKSFTTPGLNTSDNVYNVGVSLTLLSCACRATTWSIEAGYDHDWRDDGYSANMATARFTRSF